MSSAPVLVVIQSKKNHLDGFKHNSTTISKLNKTPTFRDITNLKTKLKDNLVSIDLAYNGTYGSWWLITNTSILPNGPPNEVTMLANPGAIPVYPAGGTSREHQNAIQAWTINTARYTNQ